jgi:geranylgeranyl diphosphate synthase type II
MAGVRPTTNEGGYQPVLDRLRHYHELTIHTLLQRVPKKAPGKYLWDLVPSYPMRGGKGFRPGLCIATCRALGGTTEAALHSAVALELYHNAFLVHDDVEDGSEYRRGLPTMHHEHGIGIAVNVGDAMNVLTMRPLMENLTILGPELTWLVFQEFEHMVRESVEGQAIELGWVKDNVCDLTEADYLRMTLKKTCWYTCIHPCRIGALIASHAKNLERFNRFGYFMGAAFQIQDDILNLVGDHKKYGKEIGGDIREGKRTMMLIHALNHSTAREKERLRAFLAQPRAIRSSRDVAWVYRLFAKYDSIEAARTAARHLAGAAIFEFYNAFSSLPDSEDKSFLEQIVTYMIERDL